uniref:IRG-type G domain-containing protein n=1 Tax=Acrobeloides nanus TaxID=290746 RepID=A0A914C341_9BILA
MGNDNAKEVQELKDDFNKQNQDNLRKLEELKHAQALERERERNRQQLLETQMASLQDEKAQRKEMAKLLQGEQKQKELLAEQAFEARKQAEIQIQESRAAQERMESRTREMIHKINETNTSNMQKLVQTNNEAMFKLQEEAAQRNEELNKANQAQLVSLTKECNSQIEKQSRNHQEALEKIMEQADKECNKLQRVFERQLDAMEENLKQERDRSEKLLEMQKEMLQQFLSAQDQFRAYLEKKPEHPLQKPENLMVTIKEAREKFGIDVENFYNFAFAGHTKAGKSSIINAIRGLANKDPSAAKVDVTECLTPITYYTFPDEKLSHVRLYDIPGSGTMSHNSETYFADKGLCAFDCLIIMTQKTLCQEDITFARCALNYNQPVAFVRSQCDIDMDNKVKEEEIDEIDQEEINNHLDYLQKFYAREIKERAPDLHRVPCYFVSAPELRKLVNGKGKAFYQEAKLLEYIKLMSMYQRNIV